MSIPNPVDDIAAQYLASRAEAAQCVFTADQFLTRAAAANARADALATVIGTLGGEVPVYPPVADEEEKVRPDLDEPLGVDDGTPDQAV